MPNFSAINPRSDIAIATIHQEKPFIKPEIILLYSGKTFCAITIVTGVAIIVMKPMTTNMTSDTAGCEEQVKINKIIRGKVEIIEI